MTIDQLLNSIVSSEHGASTSEMPNNQDCLGMTPLHILACSSTHNIELYECIVAISTPEGLITEDKWGCPPILYAIWGDAPHEIVELLIDRQKSAFPNHALDWDKMVETLCRAGVSLAIVKRLLNIHQASFSGQSIDWQKAARELTILLLVKYNSSIEFDWEGTFFGDWNFLVEFVTTGLANQELVQSMLEIQQRFFSNHIDLDMLCNELVKPLRLPYVDGTFGTSMESAFYFLVKYNIPERANSLGVRKWQMAIENSVEMSNDSTVYLGRIRGYLIECEHEYQWLTEAAFLLELAVWKSAVDESAATTIDMRRQCRIRCGAGIIIPNILPFLIAPAFDEDEDNGAGGDMDRWEKRMASFKRGRLAPRGN